MARPHTHTAMIREIIKDHPEIYGWKNNNGGKGIGKPPFITEKEGMARIRKALSAPQSIDETPSSDEPTNKVSSGYVTSKIIRPSDDIWNDYADAWADLKAVGQNFGHDNLVTEITGAKRTPYLAKTPADFKKSMAQTREKVASQPALAHAVEPLFQHIEKLYAEYQVAWERENAPDIKP